jgi:hypothetical protein
MTRSRQLVLVLMVATVLAAAGSHLVASWLKVRTVATHAYSIGEPNGNPPAFLAASSVGGYAISWELISTQLDTQIKTWGIAGGTPCEFEQFQKRVPEAQTTFIVVSTYDLDDALICDFHANIVPVGRTIQALLEAHADRNEWKRALSQYPMTWLRTLFPTLGRSRGIMGATLIKVKDMIKRSSRASETPAGPTINFGKGAGNDEYAQQKLSDWSPSQIAGKLVAMGVDFQGGHSFNGPKKLALERMLQYGCQRGRTIVVVSPVSPAYTKEFIHPETQKKFEEALAEVRQSVPRAEWLRLDQMPGLAADEIFCDLVHLNVFGRQLATEDMQAWLKQPAHLP